LGTATDGAAKLRFEEARIAELEWARSQIGETLDAAMSDPFDFAVDDRIEAIRRGEA
jgi:hypothetical protein